MQTLKFTIVAFIALSLASCVSSRKYNSTASSQQTWEARYKGLSQDFDDLQAWKTTCEGRYKSLDASYLKLKKEKLALEESLNAIKNNGVAPLSMSGEKIKTESARAIGAIQAQENAPLMVAVQK